MDTALMVSSPDCAGRTLTCEPITIGVPLPQGVVRDPGRLGLTGENGLAVPIQALPLEHWPDGSVRWALLDFQATGKSAAQRSYGLRLSCEERAEPSERLQILETGNGVVVETGVARFHLEVGTIFPFAAVKLGTADAIDRSTSGLFVTDRAGRSWRARIMKVEVGDRGALRSAVRLEGYIGPRYQPLMLLTAWMHFFAGSAATRVAVTLRNPRRARHAGGFWDLGDRGSVYVRDVSVRVGLPAPATAVSGSAEIDATLETFDVPFELYQDSSGGARWDHITHVNRDRVVPCTFRGYRLQRAGLQRHGLRATPAVQVKHAGGSTAIAVEHFWQNFPKALEADERSITLRLWPRQFADVHELQGGEQKTHRFTLAFGEDPMARDSLFWGRTPSLAAATPRWYGHAEAVPYLAPASEDSDQRYRQLVSAAVDGSDSFEAKREVIDEYGWRNFGDLYADHENAFSGEREPIVSHYNNQYDAIHGFAVQYMRTGDARWWRLMRELAWHVTDIDIYHTDRDKAAYNHGLFWHTYHYVPAGASSHRSYPRRPGVCGGGPANEHNYTAGLRLHWLLTGDHLAREGAVGLANWVINMDDGRKSVCRWVTRADTGLASATQSTDFHGPGRGAGHSILALIDGHRLTGECRFLSKAEQLIRRSITPADDIAALNLLDAERRWSYTVFLQALGKYLDYKRELGEIDASYAFSREALLHYARWMADHEHPYLDTPEILEYPTETWVAQDMRKSEVFAHAAQQAPASERLRFLERARFFFAYSVTALLASPTRTLARPVVLLLSNGFMLANDRPLADRSDACAKMPARFAPPPTFVPQKVKAKNRLARIAAAIAVIAALSTIACFAIL